MKFSPKTSNSIPARPDWLRWNTVHVFEPDMDRPIRRIPAAVGWTYSGHLGRGKWESHACRTTLVKHGHVRFRHALPSGPASSVFFLREGASRSREKKNQTTSTSTPPPASRNWGGWMVDKSCLSRTMIAPAEWNGPGSRARYTILRASSRALAVEPNSRLVRHGFEDCFLFAREGSRGS